MNTKHQPTSSNKTLALFYNLKFLSKYLFLLNIMFFISIFLFIKTECFSQGTAINTTGATADNSAGLDIQFNDKGLLIPRLTTTERNSIQNPANGLQIINTTTNCLEIYFNPTWQSIYCACTTPASPTAGVSNPLQTEITWNWNTVTGASGYKYNSINDYSTATDNGTNTSYSQSGLTCNKSYTLYVWAYNNCGASTELTLSENTTSCFTCGDNFTDNRDAHSYQTVQIGNQCWMKENLNYDQNSFGNDWCYDNDANNCTIYGRLYDWEATMAGASTSSSNPSGVQGVCPTGWHVPSDVEWTQLTDYLSANSQYWCGGISTQIAKSLAATTNWNTYTTTCESGNDLNTNNSSGFTALPGGARNTSGAYSDIKDRILLWSATDDISGVRTRILYSTSSTINKPMLEKSYGLSVRCLKD